MPALQRLQGFLLPSSSLLVLLMSLIYPRRKLLEPLQVGLHSSGRSIERFAVLWLLPVWVVDQMVQYKTRVALEQQEGLRLVAF